MREFKVKNGNFIKSSNSTSKMMCHVIISLLPIMLFAFYKNGILPLIKGYGSITEIFKILIILIICPLISLVTEYLFYLVKKEKKSIKYLLTQSFAIIPGMFISLIIPINTPVWLLTIACIIASLGKMLFGGLGKNIFNPALSGALIIIVFASSYIASQGGYLNAYEVDAVSSATPLANFSALSMAGTYQDIVGPYGSLWSFFFGNIPGALGETSSLLCISAFVYLLANEVIKWRISFYYILTMFVSTLIIGITNNMGLWYPVFCVLSGGLLFGATFMATDPVTSPITKHSQVLGGIILGILTLSIRYLTSYPEGVLISILIFNLITILLNKLDIKYSYSNLYKTLSLIIIVIMGLTMTMVISNKVDYNPNSNTNQNFQVTDTEKNGSTIIYYVTSRGYSGKNSIKSKITMKDNNIINLEIISNKESYYGMIEKENYVNKIIEKQNNLSQVEVVSGATYTSNYLKELIEKIKEYDKVNN